jgi:FMN phosphatase YigB (HAD superfamily)
MLRQACTDLGVAPSSALMVGDREDDAGAAAALGMRFVPAGERPWEANFLSPHYFDEHEY